MRPYLVPLAVWIGLILCGFLIDASLNRYVQLILLYACANIVLALSLNLVNGFTGQFSIGHAGFMAIGAYISAYMSLRAPNGTLGWAIFPPSLDVLNFTFFTIVGGLGAAVAGWLVGLPSLRLRGDYLAIVTLGFGEIIRVALLNLSAVGGARGLYGIPTPGVIELGPVTFTKFEVKFALATFWVVVTFTTLWRLIHSLHGRLFMSVREDEIAAQAMGVNTTQVKVRSFVISSFFAGIGGALFTQATQYLNPSTFSFAKSVDFIIMIVLGGMGSLTGSVVAAIFVTLFPEFVLRPLQEWTQIDFRMVIYALTLILFMIARPKGIFGTAEAPDFLRWLRRSRALPEPR